jgi:general secretion pathway protein N
LAPRFKNQSRTPEIAPPKIDEKLVEGELDAALTGVIVTETVKIAFVRDNKTNEVQRVKLGQPMEGEQSGWTLVSVEPRKAMFEGGGQQAELELSVDEKGAPPPTPVLPAGPASMPPTQPVGDQPGSQPPQPVAQAQGQPANADEIRKRIEERRRQLREEAQRMMQEQQQQKQ